MALPATDNFNGTTGDQLVDYNASWTLNDGDFDIVGNATIAPDDAGFCLAHWNADAFADNQYAQLVHVDSGFNWLGPAVRVGAAAVTGYTYSCRSSARNLSRWVAGAETALAAVGSGTSDNDVLRLEASGTTITPILNAVTDAGLGAQTDATIASGSAGICGYGAAGTSDEGDDWEGGNLGGAPAGNPWYYYAQM